jgi:hypothetical protein
MEAHADVVLAAQAEPAEVYRQTRGKLAWN